MISSHVRRKRHGFTLAEVVVTGAILVIIAAAIVPSFAGYYGQKRVSDTRDVLVSLGLSLNNANPHAGRLGFLQAVSALKKYPSTLTQLNVVFTRADKQCGGTAYNSILDTSGTPGSLYGWRSFGPYSGLNIVPGKGVETPLGWVHDSVIKGTAAAGTVGWVELHLDTVPVTDAEALDQTLDGAIDAAAGLIRYSATSGVAPITSFRLIRFLVPSPLSAGCP